MVDSDSFNELPKQTSTLCCDYLIAEKMKRFEWCLHSAVCLQGCTGLSENTAQSRRRRHISRKKDASHVVSLGPVKLDGSKTTCGTVTTQISLCATELTKCYSLAYNFNKTARVKASDRLRGIGATKV